MKDRIDRIDAVDQTARFNAVIGVNGVIMAPAGKFISKRPAERLVQQRFLQRLQRGELLLVDGGEAGGFGGESVELGDDPLLFFERFWESN